MFTRLQCDVTVLVCSADFSHPDPGAAARNSESAWSEHRVGTSLNMASDVLVAPHHRSLFTHCDIVSRAIPLRDTTAAPPPDDLVTLVLDAYAGHLASRGPTRSLMINCLAGLNRSVLAAVIVLWNAARPRPWADADACIEYVRGEVTRQRGVPPEFVLANAVFVDFLRRVCV